MKSRKQFVTENKEKYRKLTSQNTDELQYLPMEGTWLTWDGRR